uniref:RM55 protein n=1 Tax=Hymenolepis diminuta TaxID=6216 RepID=A0A0R3SLX0_HYMDI
LDELVQRQRLLRKSILQKHPRPIVEVDHHLLPRQQKPKWYDLEFSQPLVESP